ncbi:MAG: YdjY domain-containing protein [Phycisphaerae bacterium]|nr:YdjY domain-containing protein [Phycisphaerae bacterium]MDP7288158.1 YdjY domain-containing protein [Phycisphaerae bacterium]
MTASVRLIISGWMILAIASAISAADPEWSWPTHRGNSERTGNLDGSQGPQKPSVLWVYKSPEHFVASIVPGDKSIYAGGLGAFNTGVFHSISSDVKPTDRVTWSKNAPYIQRPTVCAPVISNGMLIFGDGMHQTDDALLYCVTTDTGLPVWTYPVPGKLVHIEGSPTLDRQRVYFGAGAAGVICIDTSQLTIEGKSRSPKEVIAIQTAKWSELNTAYQAEKKKNPELAIPPTAELLPKATPRLRWQAGKGTWHVDAPIATAGEYVFVASAYLDAEKVGKRSLMCLKASSGKVVWDAKLELNPWSGPTVAGHAVIIGCSSIRFDRKLIPKASGQVLAINVADGRVLWSNKIAGGVLSSVAVKDGLAVYTCTDGKIYARKHLTGELVWTYNAKTPFFAGAALAGKTVYAADLKSIVHAIDLTTGSKRWVMDIGSDPSVQARGTVFGSPVVHGGNLYVATCNLDGATDQPSVVVCLSDQPTAAVSLGRSASVDAKARTVTVPCRIAERKLATLKEIYPLEVIASLPYPRGQKAHETVLAFDVKPSDVHKAIESLGLKPGKPAKGTGASAQGPEVRISLEFPGITGKTRTIPISKALVDTRTGRPMPPLKWRFTGSAMRKRDPSKPDLTFGADLSGTLISIFPVTDETVLQSNMTLKEESLLKLETNQSILPPIGTEVKLIIKALP